DPGPGHPDCHQHPVRPGLVIGDSQERSSSGHRRGSRHPASANPQSRLPMDKALYIAMTGARASLQAQATVSHNLANADTAGFKAVLANTEAFPVRGAGYPSRVAALHVD